MTARLTVLAFVFFTLPVRAQNRAVCQSFFQQMARPAAAAGETKIIVPSEKVLEALLDEYRGLRAERREQAESGQSTAAIDLELGEIKKLKGVQLIVQSVSATATQMDEVIIVRNYNEASLQNLSRSTATKPLDLHVKTARVGPLAGFIPKDPRVSAPTLTTKELRALEDEVAQLIESGVVRVKSIDGGDILTDSRGYPITSDLDLWGILRHHSGGELLLSQSQGWIRESDEPTIARINQNFHDIDFREVRRDLVQHGPWSAHPEMTETDYPLWAFLPSREVRRIDHARALDEFIAEMAQHGYHHH